MFWKMIQDKHVGNAEKLNLILANNKIFGHLASKSPEEN
jgi:hypothetical protein